MFLMATGLCWGCAATIEESPPGPKLDRFNLVGNRAVSNRAIKSRLVNRETRRWPFAPTRYLDPYSLELDLRRIERYYQTLGYYNAKILGHEKVHINSDEVTVTVWIREGPPVIVEEVVFQLLDDTDLLHLRTKLSSGSVLTDAQLDALETEIQDHLESMGHALAEVQAHAYVDPVENLARVVVRIEGGPLVRYGDTHFTGEPVVSESLLQRRLAYRVGQQYAPGLLARTELNLHELGLYYGVRAHLDMENKVGQADMVPVVIRLQPAPKSELRLGFGAELAFNRQEALALASWRHNNFLGGARLFRTTLRAGYAALPDLTAPTDIGPLGEFTVELGQPDFLEPTVRLHASASYQVGIEEGYRFLSPGANIWLRRHFGSALLLGVGYTIRNYTFHNVSQALADPYSNPLGLDFRSLVTLSYLEQMATLDNRDDPIRSRQGSYLSLRAQQTGGLLSGTHTYYRFLGDLRLYKPLYRRLVLATHLAAGVARPWGAKSGVPIAHRFFAGGPGSVRGFYRNRLGPSVEREGETVPVGGLSLLQGTGELRFEISSSFGLVAFWDAGHVSADSYHYAISDLNSSIGVGGRYFSSVGPIRLDLGFRLNNFDHYQREPNWALHIGVGEAF